MPKGEWLHVAIVNDPEKDTVEMFVNGAPILRDVLGAEGLATAGDPWLIGANMWEGDPANPWFGHIGETRIVHGALSPDQWLTARAQDAPEPAGSTAGSSLGGVLGLAAMIGGVAAGVMALLNLDHPVIDQARTQLHSLGLL